VLQQGLADLPEISIDALHLHLGRLVEVMRSKDARARAQPISQM
jgi:nitrate reductase NapAB chaperone NapD